MVEYVHTSQGLITILLYYLRLKAVFSQYEVVQKKKRNIRNHLAWRYKEKIPEQNLTSAKDLTMMLPEDRDYRPDYNNYPNL